MKLKTIQLSGLHFFLVLIMISSNAMAIEAVYEGGDGILAQVFVNCVGCHSSSRTGGARNGAPSSVNFDTYNAAVNSGSRAVARGSAGTMPPGGANALNSTQIAALQAWQTAGFPLSAPPANTAPVANAGPNQSIDEDTPVILNGSGSDNEDGSNVSYHWQQTGGETVTLQNSNSAQASFTAPSVENNSTLTFLLTVTDSEGLTATAITTVSVTNIVTENQAPVANAGPNQSIDEDTPVILNGSGSDNEDGSNVSYHWQQTGGETVSLQNSNSAQASFTAPSVENNSTLTFILTVTDSMGLTATAITNVTVNDVMPMNQPPVADAGNAQTLAEGEQGTLNGSGSFDTEDGTSLGYHWSQLSGTPVILSSTMEASATFTIPEIITPTETMTFQLQVTDSSGQNNNTGTDTVLLTVIKNNADFFQQLPELNAVILDNSSGEISGFDSATFSSALFTDEQIVLNNQLTEDQTTFIASRIGVSEQHLAETADLLIVAAYTTPGGETTFFQKNSDEQFEVWDVQFSTLQPYRSNIVLEMIYDISVYSGPLFRGKYELYLGYRLADGSVIFNGEAHTFNVN